MDENKGREARSKGCGTKFGGEVENEIKRGESGPGPDLVARRLEARVDVEGVNGL